MELGPRFTNSTPKWLSTAVRKGWAGSRRPHSQYDWKTGIWPLSPDGQCCPIAESHFTRLFSGIFPASSRAWIFVAFISDSSHSETFLTMAFLAISLRNREFWVGKDFWGRQGRVGGGEDESSKNSGSNLGKGKNLSFTPQWVFITAGLGRNRVSPKVGTVSGTDATDRSQRVGCNSQDCPFKENQVRFYTSSESYFLGQVFLVERNIDRKGFSSDHSTTTTS